jgi:orotate phosphoribosyltransferase
MASDSLTAITQRAWYDLLPHEDEFDAIVCAGDMHGVAIASAIASVLERPLMIVCVRDHACVDSHIVTIGDVDPRMRFLYVDDWFSFGASKKRTFAYMNQSAKARIVATYAAATREYTPEKEEVTA